MAMANLSCCCKRVLSCLFLYAVHVAAASGAVPPGNETDRVALLAIKDRISRYPLRALSSWNESLHFCQWEGIACTGGTGRVTALRLQSRQLAGSLSPSLGNLTFLRELNVGDNKLRGGIPPELGKLHHLRILNLTTNSLDGEIPANLSSCRELRVMDLGENALVRSIPTEITTLPKLEVLYLLVNNLTGIIPPSIGNLSSLITFASGRNALQGTIPEQIGHLSGLDFLQVAENQLSGTIARSLFNLSSLSFLAFADNQLEGALPPDLGVALPKLETLYAASNQLQAGPVPASLSNASALQNLDLAYNSFTGPIPRGIGRLGSLLWLNFEGNQLGAGETDALGFITSLANCTNLEMLDIADNNFEGELPGSIANLSSQLSMLIMGGNQIRGAVPDGVKNLASLSVLRLEGNLLSGSIPASVGKLHNLGLLSLFGNMLSGQIPSSIGNLSQLIDLRLQENGLEGAIPSSLGSCRSLQYMVAYQNKLNGTIPRQLLGLASLSRGLRLSHNSLVGPLASNIGELKNLWQMDLSENRLSGEIPASLGDCESLESLEMEGNLFSGSIPSSLSNLKGIQYLDLSRNNLSGRIPEYLGTFRALQHLNLSFNNFEGQVPQGGVFQSATTVSVVGNGKLCGNVSGVLELPPCLNQTSTETRAGNRLVKVLVPVICVVLGLLILLATFLWIKRLRPRPPSMPLPPLGDQHRMVSYNELFRATDGFSPENLIGVGSYGAVYKGVLDQNSGTAVAVKVLNLQRRGAYKSFTAECEALRNIRHRNLTRVWTSCSSIDTDGNDFRALVFEFMPNGSLERWLHPSTRDEGHQSRHLSFAERLNIATDVACAMEYLHRHCHVPIVHCDLKPSNVLLDGDMTAHVGDFGLARILSCETGSPGQSKTTMVRGTIGYVPPEYGMGAEVSTQGDVYSYGILLLEMFTGLRPTDGMFEDRSGLREYAEAAFPDRVTEILDPRMPTLPPEAPDAGTEPMMGYGSMRSRIEDCITSVFRLGTACSAHSPKDRMDMGDVAAQMRAVRDTFLFQK